MTNRRLPAAVVRGEQGQHVADGPAQALVEDAHEALALCWIGERLSLGRDVERQLLLDQHEVGRVLVGRDGAVGGEAERAGKLAGELRGVGDVGGARGLSAAIRLGSCHSGSPSVRQ